MHHRDLEWQVIGAPRRILHVRSLDGRFSIQAMIDDDKFVPGNGRIASSAILAPNVIGTEFPLGCEYAQAEFRLGTNGFVRVRYGIVHTELVRSCIEQWTHRKRFRDRQLRPSAIDDGAGDHDCIAKPQFSLLRLMAAVTCFAVVFASFAILRNPLRHEGLLMLIGEPMAFAVIFMPVIAFWLLTGGLNREVRFWLAIAVFIFSVIVVLLFLNLSWAALPQPDGTHW